MTTKTQPRVLGVTYYEIPDYYAGLRRPVKEGDTLREALDSLRGYCRDYFGDIGCMTAELTDGTGLYVSLTPASDIGYLMASQRIERMHWSDQRFKVLRRYKW